MTLLLPRRAIARPERALIVTGVGTPITPGSTMTKVPGTTGDMYAGGGVTSGTAWRLVAPADGRYLLKANIPFEVSEAQEVEFGFVVNGTATGSERLRPGNPGASREAVAHLSDSLDLSAGDYVEPFCRCTASGTASISVNLGIGLGLGMSRQAAVAVAGFTVPLLASNCLSFLHADSGPVGTPTTAVGNDVTDWISLTDATGGGGPYDWEQTGASDRGVISETTMSGGRRTVDFDGSTEFLLAATGLGAEVAGTAVPYTRVLHIQVITQNANFVTYASFGDASGTSMYDLLRDPSTADGILHVQRRGTGSALVANSTGTYTAEELYIVDIFHGTTRSMWVADEGGAVKVMTGVAQDTGLTNLLDTASLAAWFASGSALGHSNIGVRRHALYNVALNDTQAQQLCADYGT